MAAVMALVFLFALASVALVIKVSLGGLTFVTAFAALIFTALACGVFVGTFILARRYENE